MLAKDLKSKVLFPLKQTDSVAFAIEMLEDYGIQYLPVADNTSLIGSVELTKLLAVDASLTLAEVMDKSCATVFPDNSFFKVLEVASTWQVDNVAVALDGDLHGIINLKELGQYLGKTHAVKGEGSVIFMQSTPNNYSLSSISRLVELADGKIQALWTQMAENGLFQILVKLDIQHIDTILESLENMQIEVLMAVNQKDNQLLKARYEALLKYLEI